MRTTTSRATRRPGGSRRTALATLSAAALAATLLVAGSPAQADRAGAAAETSERAASPRVRDRIVSGGQAYGSQIRGLDIIGSGRTGYSTTCTAKVNGSASNSVAATTPTLGDVLDLGVIESAQQIGRNEQGQRSSTSTTTVAGANLLGQLGLEIGAISARATVTKTASGYRTDFDSEVASISLGGVPLPLDELNNNLPGEIPLGPLGTIYFNETQSRTTRDEGFGQLTVLRIELTALDAEIKLGVASARMQSRRPAAFLGGAWSTDVAVLGILDSGRTGYQPIPCGGTQGKTLRTNDTAGIRVPGAVEIGATDSLTRTQRLANGDIRAVASNELAGVNLGDGALNIEAITAKVVTIRKPSGRVVKRPSFKILGVTAGGQAQELPLPGEKFEIPGLGYLQIGDVRRFSDGARVTALTLVVLEGENELRVRIGTAQARVRR